MTLILPRYQARIHQYGFPRLAIIAGQPGAGKTQAKIIVKNGMSIDFTPVLTVDLDVLRPYHPVTNEMQPGDVLDYPEWTNEDAYLWTRQLLDAARMGNANVIYENTLSNVDTIKEVLGEFAGKQYALDLHCMATASKDSVQGVFKRFTLSEVDRLGKGRWVPPSYHDAVYDAFPRNAQILQDEKLVGLIAVYDRDKCLHETTLGPAGWSDATPISEVITKARDRDWSQNKTAKFRHNWEGIFGLMSITPNFIPEVIEEAKPYVDEARLLEQSSKLTVADDAKAGEVLHVTPHHVFVGIEGELRHLSHTPVRPLDLQAGDEWRPRPYPKRMRSVSSPKI